MKKQNLAWLAILAVSTTVAICSSWGAFKRFAQADPPADDSPSVTSLGDAAATPMATHTASATQTAVTAPAPSAAVQDLPTSAAAVASTNDLLAQLRADVLASTYGQMPIKELLILFRETTGGRELQEIMTAIVVRKAEALPLIKEILRSGNRWEKHAATQLLSISPWPETYAELLQLAQAPAEQTWVRQGALFALGALGKPEAGAAIVAILQESDLSPPVQLPAISALARIGYPDAVEALRTFTTNDNLQVRIFAWRSLQELGQPADRDFLLSLLADKDYVVREDACGALALVTGDAVTQRLREISGQDETQAVRQSAHQALIRRALPGRSDAEKMTMLQEELARAEWHTQPWIILTMLEECGPAGQAGVEALARKDDRLGERARTYLLWRAAR